jgi:hypothetical protein
MKLAIYKLRHLSRYRSFTEFVSQNRAGNWRSMLASITFTR